MSTLAALQQAFQSYVLQGEPDVVARIRGDEQVADVRPVDARAAQVGDLHEAARRRPAVPSRKFQVSSRVRLATSDL